MGARLLQVDGKLIPHRRATAMRGVPYAPEDALIRTGGEAPAVSRRFRTGASFSGPVSAIRHALHSSISWHGVEGRDSMTASCRLELRIWRGWFR
jgi:hypothetical protein